MAHPLPSRCLEAAWRPHPSARPAQRRPSRIQRGTLSRRESGHERHVAAPPIGLRCSRAGGNGCLADLPGRDHGGNVIGAVWLVPSSALPEYSKLTLGQWDTVQGLDERSPAVPGLATQSKQTGHGVSNSGTAWVRDARLLRFLFFWHFGCLGDCGLGKHPADRLDPVISHGSRPRTTHSPSVGGRAPPGRKTPTPCEGSRSPGLSLGGS